QQTWPHHEATVHSNPESAASSLDYISVHVHGARAERLEVDRCAQGAPDQALDLDRAAVRTPTGRVSCPALARGSREHAVLGGDPAFPARLAPGRYAGDQGRGADQHRLPDGDQ